jgi:hypothetical protein
MVFHPRFNYLKQAPEIISHDTNIRTITVQLRDGCRSPTTVIFYIENFDDFQSVRNKLIPNKRVNIFP